MPAPRGCTQVLLAVVLAACQPTQEPFGEHERRAVTDSVRAGMASYAEALGSLDAERILGHYVAGAEFRLASDGNTYSYADMQGVLGALRGAYRALGVRWDTLAVTVLGPDAAFVYAPFRRADTASDGSVSRIRGVATWVWVRRDGAWRMLYGHGDHYPDSSAAR